MNLEVHEHAMYVALTNILGMGGGENKSLGGKSPRSPSNTYMNPIVAFQTGSWLHLGIYL